MESDLENTDVVTEQPRERPRTPIVKSHLVDNAWLVFNKYKNVPDEHLPHPWCRIIRYEGEREDGKIVKDRSKQAHSTAARLRASVPRSWPPGLWEMWAEVEFDETMLQGGIEIPSENSKLFLRLVTRQEKPEFLPADKARGFTVETHDDEGENS